MSIAAAGAFALGLGAVTEMTVHLHLVGSVDGGIACAYVNLPGSAIFASLRHGHFQGDKTASDHIIVMHASQEALAQF